MSNLREFAKETGALCVGATAFALGDPSGGTLLATPLVALTALGLTLNTGCAAKAEAKAQAAILKQHQASGAFSPEHITRAGAILKDAPATARLDPKAIAAAVHGADFEDTLSQALLTQLHIGADDHQVRTLIHSALRAGIAACKADETFRAALSLELILETARQQKINLATLNRIDQTITDTRDEVRVINAKIDSLPGTFESLLQNLQRASRDQMEALASRFEIERVFDLSDTALREALEKRATDFRTLQAEVAAIPDTLVQLSNLKGAAQGAINRGALDEVETLLNRVQEVELDEAAKTGELRANNALLRGRAAQAFTILTAAADSFAAIHPLEPATRRLAYADRLYQHGLRYGGDGLALAAQMIHNALDRLDRTTDPALWAGAQNNVGAALQEQGIRTAGTAGADLLGQAVAAFGKALTVRTKDAMRLDWAGTQNNLGIALTEQAIRTAGTAGADLLGQAVAAFGKALTVRTIDAMPQHWAETQFNMALVEQARAAHDSCADPQAALTDALAHVEAALQVYHPIHTGFYHEKATRLREKILTALRGFEGGV